MIHGTRRWVIPTFERSYCSNTKYTHETIEGISVQHKWQSQRRVPRDMSDLSKHIFTIDRVILKMNPELEICPDTYDQLSRKWSPVTSQSQTRTCGPANGSVSLQVGGSAAGNQTCRAWWWRDECKYHKSVLSIAFAITVKLTWVCLHSDGNIGGCRSGSTLPMAVPYIIL